MLFCQEHLAWYCYSNDIFCSCSKVYQLTQLLI